MAVSIVALIIYVFGLPAVTLVTTVYAHRKDKLRDVRYLQTIGLFYKEYEPEYYWWDIVFLMRRFSLCLCSIVFHGMPYVQGGMAILTITSAAILQFVHKPYWDKRVNDLDCMCCLSIMLHCIAVLYYNNQDFTTARVEGGLALDGLLVAADVICFASTGLLFCKTFLENAFRGRSCEVLTKRIVQAQLHLQKALVANRDSFKQLLLDHASWTAETVGMTQPLGAAPGNGTGVPKPGSGTLASASSSLVPANIMHGTTTDVALSGTDSGGLDARAPTTPHLAAALGHQVTYENFAAAASQVLEGQGLGVAPAAIESLFLTLKLIDVDDDEHSGEMSLVTRDKLADKSPIPFELVREFLGYRDAVLIASKSVRLTKSKANPSDVVRNFTKGCCGGPSAPKEQQFAWNPVALAVVVRKVLTEIVQTLKPEELRMWIKTSKVGVEHLLGLFNLSVWLAPLIPDYAQIGAYSKSSKALAYKQAANRLPDLVSLSAFGDDDICEHMRVFMDLVEAADKRLTQDERNIVLMLDRKDRGPLLYWLLNIASRVQRFEFADLLSQMINGNRKPYTPTNEVSRRLSVAVDVELQARKSSVRAIGESCSDGSKYRVTPPKAPDAVES
jgi:hypothetical protein